MTLEPVEPLLFDRTGELAGKTGRGGLGTFRIDKGEEVQVPHLIQEGEGRLEIGIGLAGKPDDDIPSHKESRPRLPERRHRRQILTSAVPPVHPLQDGVGTGLGGEVNMAAELGKIDKTGNQLR